MSQHDPLEFKRFLLLGGQVSRKHTAFQKLAKVGFEEAEVMSFFMWLKYMSKNPEVSFEDGIIKLVELLGMAHFLKNTKELTRLSMILGDTRKKVTY